MRDFDIIVVGAGNAALAAANSAREEGADRVLVLEKASEAERGGNTWFSGGLLRIAYGASARPGAPAAGRRGTAAGLLRQRGAVHRRGFPVGPAAGDGGPGGPDARAHPDRKFLPDHPLDARGRGGPDGGGRVPRRNPGRQQGEVSERSDRSGPPGGHRALPKLVRPHGKERDRDPLRDPERSPCSGTGAAVSWAWRRRRRPGWRS